MNKITERIDGFFNKLGFVMNSATETQEFLRAVPNPVPGTHLQCIEWGKIGNADVLWLYPAPHPLETVAHVTNHFEDLDDDRLRYVCGQAKIEPDTLKLTATPDDKLPKTIREAMLLALREKVPMPKGKPMPTVKAVQVRERVVVLSPEVADVDIKGLEKFAAMAGGINAFKAAQAKGATIAQLRALVSQLKEKKKNAEMAEQTGRAAVLGRG